MRESVQKGEIHPSSQQYRTLLEVAEAIVSNRELSALFNDLAGLLHRVARFDYLWLNLHDGASDTLHLHVMEPADLASPGTPLPVQDPATWVWQNQRPVVTSNRTRPERGLIIISGRSRLDTEQPLRFAVDNSGASSRRARFRLQATGRLQQPGR